MDFSWAVPTASLETESALQGYQSGERQNQTLQLLTKTHKLRVYYESSIQKWILEIVLTCVFNWRQQHGDPERMYNISLSQFNKIKQVVNTLLLEDQNRSTTRFIECYLCSWPTSSISAMSLQTGLLNNEDFSDCSCRATRQSTEVRKRLYRWCSLNKWHSAGPWVHASLVWYVLETQVKSQHVLRWRPSIIVAFKMSLNWLLSSQVYHLLGQRW